MRRRSVDLPQPERPTIASNCPAGMARSSSDSTRLSPKDLDKPIKQYVLPVQ